MNFYREYAIPKRVKLDILFENSEILAFRHTEPSYEEHAVVIPKKHIDSILDLTELDGDLVAKLMLVCKEIALQIIKKTGKARIITNAGGYQDTKHLHFHVISD